jgi:hypothetical protein
MKPYEEIRLHKNNVLKELKQVEVLLQSIVDNYKNKTGGSIRDFTFKYREKSYDGGEYIKYELYPIVSYYD